MINIFIVDDNEDSRVLLKKMLESAGHAVQTAADGTEALQMMKLSAPDLIISDILMPQMDGFSLCQEIRKEELLRKTPFVFYTATYTDPRDKELAMALGASRFIIKPAEPDEFIRIINDVIQEYKGQQLIVQETPLKNDAELSRMHEESLETKLAKKSS